MLYLLDTNTCIAVMRNVVPVVDRMAALSPTDCGISTITAYELFTGIAKCANPANEIAKVTRLLTTVNELAFDSAAAREAGGLRALLESKGGMIGPYDILLAGHAVSAGLILVTANTGVQPSTGVGAGELASCSGTMMGGNSEQANSCWRNSSE